MKKQLIIVCEENDMKYATYLQQLVSAIDDEEGRIVGVKDGTVSAVIWDEKHYLANIAQLTSSNHVLFIGNFETAKSARANMKERFNKLGMHYGWLGTQACMNVTEGMLNKDNYEEFRQLCDEYGKKFKSKLELHYSPLEKSDADDDEHPSAEVEIEPAKQIGIIERIADGLAEVGKQGLIVVKQMQAVIDKGHDAFQAKEARDQQYTLLTLILYTDGLSEFLGE